MFFKIKVLTLQTIGKIFQSFGKGSSIVGYIDEKLNLKTLSNLDFDNKEVTFIVGTNGKTTINNVINSIYKNENKKVLSNLKGANLLRGIKNTIIMDIDKDKIKSDVLILEVDEKNLKSVSELIKPNQIIVTNFFRDQLDRYFEIDTIIDEIINTIKILKPKVFYNAQDPLIYDRIKNVDAPKVSFILNEDETAFKNNNGITEIKYCPDCKIKLKYNYYHYGHIGDFYCPNCNFKVTDYKYEFKYENNYLLIDQNNKIKLPNNTPKYLVINYSLIFSYILENQLSVNSFQKVIDDNKQIKGRNNYINTNDKQIYLNLAKNVVGMEQTIKNLQRDDKIDLLIVFNDNYADGKDVSWIWDVDFTPLIEKLNSLHIVGLRKNDMKLRFLYEDYDNIFTYDTIKEGLDKIIKLKNPKIVSNYTPMRIIVNYFESKK